MPRRRRRHSQRLFQDADSSIQRMIISQMFSIRDKDKIEGILATVPMQDPDMIDYVLLGKIPFTGFGTSHRSISLIELAANLDPRLLDVMLPFVSDKYKKTAVYDIENIRSCDAKAAALLPLRKLYVAYQDYIQYFDHMNYPRRVRATDKLISLQRQVWFCEVNLPEKRTAYINYRGALKSKTNQYPVLENEVAHDLAGGEPTQQYHVALSKQDAQLALGKIGLLIQRDNTELEKSIASLQAEQHVRFAV